MLKTAIIGASGFIGRHLLSGYRSAFPDTIGTSFSSPRAGLTFFDIRTPDISGLRLEEQGYQSVIIAAANPNIGYCEQNREAAHAVNVQGTLELVRQLGKTSLQTIFLSTDYVFEGTEGSYEDAAPTAPTTEYGRHKETVERSIPSLASKHLILRISKIYGIEKGDNTLLDEIATNLAVGSTVLSARDQVFCPTYVVDLVQAIVRIQSEIPSGIYNVCSDESWSRYEVASSLAEEMCVDPQLVKSISLYDLPSMAGRPLNTSLKCSAAVRAIQQQFTPLVHSIKVVAEHWKK